MSERFELFVNGLRFFIAAVYAIFVIEIVSGRTVGVLDVFIGVGYQFFKRIFTFRYFTDDGKTLRGGIAAFYVGIITVATRYERKSAFRRIVSAVDVVTQSIPFQYERTVRNGKSF